MISEYIKNTSRESQAFSSKNNSLTKALIKDNYHPLYEHVPVYRHKIYSVNPKYAHSTSQLKGNQSYIQKLKKTIYKVFENPEESIDEGPNKLPPQEVIPFLKPICKKFKESKQKCWKIINGKKVVIERSDPLYTELCQEEMKLELKCNKMDYKTLGLTEKDFEEKKYLPGVQQININPRFNLDFNLAGKEQM